MERAPASDYRKRHHAVPVRLGQSALQPLDGNLALAVVQVCDGGLHDVVGRREVGFARAEANDVFALRF